jgi:hypothetical protein
MKRVVIVRSRVIKKVLAEYRAGIFGIGVRCVQQGSLTYLAPPGGCLPNEAPGLRPPSHPNRSA